MPETLSFRCFHRPIVCIASWLSVVLLSGTHLASGEPFQAWVVHAAHPGANDANPGSADAPFRTINGAITALREHLKPGDTLWIKDGIYRETVALIRPDEPGHAARIPSGTSFLEMFTLAAHPGHRPVIKGSDVVTGWVRDEADVWVREDWAFNSQQVFADGVLLEQIGGQMAAGFVQNAWNGRHKRKTRAEMFAGSFHYDADAKRLSVWLPDGADPNDVEMEADARTRLLAISPGLEYVRISGLTLRHGSNVATEFAFGVNGRHCLIDRIDQSHHSFGGGYVGGHYNTVSHSRFNHNGNNGMGGAGRGHRLLFNETHYNNYRNWSTGWHAGGTKFIPGAHDWLLRGHVAAYNNGCGIWFDGWMSGVTIEECFSYRNRGAGIHYEIGSRAVIKNNVIYENGMRGIYLSNASYSMVGNNLVYRNGMSGICSIVAARRDHAIYARGEEGLIPGGNNVVSGNILVDNCSVPYLLEALPDWDMPDAFKEYFAQTLDQFKTWTNRPELIMPDEPGGNEGSYSDYNIFYRSGERGQPERLSFGRNWDVGFAYGLEDWAEKTGWDRNSIFAPPQFVDEAAYDFRPADDCPSLWFVKKVDQGVWFEMGGGKRPGWCAPATAGPYGGTPEQFKTAQQAVESDDVLLRTLPRIESGHIHRLANLTQVLMTAFDMPYVTPLQRGLMVEGTPYLVATRQVLFLSAAPDPAVLRASVSPNWTLNTLSMLLAGAPAEIQPFARITLHRDDGVSIVLDVSGDAEENLTVVSNGNPVPVEPVWAGDTTYWRDRRRTEPARVFQLRWTNDNPWLPIREIEAELLDPEAELVILGLTGQRDR